ncbi:hypothetical protein D3C80_1622830 [compost metagenome]
MLRDKVAVVLIARVVSRGRFIQRAATQHHQHRRHAVADALAEVAGLERRRDHLVDDHRTLRIGQPVFQAIADFDTQLALIPCNDQQGAVVLVLLPDPPIASQLITVVIDAGTLQVG